jgi:hypothetical protein
MPLQKTKGRWRYGLTELVIVIAGVLIALAADGWMEQRTLRDAEVESLGRLIKDMEVDIEDFSGNLARTQRGLDAAKWLMDHRGGPFPDPETLSERLTDFTACSILSPNTSEYAALKSSGQLATLRNAGFRQELTNHYERYGLMSAQYDNDCRVVEEGVAAIAHFIEFGLDPELDTWPVIVTGSPSDLLTNASFQKSVGWAAQLRLGLSVRAERMIADLSALRARASELTGD